VSSIMGLKRSWRIILVNLALLESHDFFNIKIIPFNGLMSLSFLCCAKLDGLNLFPWTQVAV
jgi:hypothetical protein